MAITWADVTTWQTGPLESIASDLLAAGKGLSATHEAGEDAASAIQSQGKAVTAMRATTISNLASLERAITNINGALMAVEGARDGVASVLADINALEAFAETNDCTIHPDGSVTGKGTQNARGEASSALAIIGNNIKKILEEADRIDTELFHALSDINNDRYTDANGKAHTGAYDQAQADYNKALAEYETAQAAYDKKRATQIPDDVHKGRAAYDDTELTKARKKMEKAKEIYDDLAAIRNETNNSERRKAGQAETYLLDFNYDKKYERTTAIVSSGNPDTATHVSTLVPGIGTNVRGDLGDYIARNDRLRHQTTHAGLDPANVATISYLGYVAPKNNAADLSITQAADIGFAERGAPKLARFEEGLRASADARGHQFTNTLLGHSYGSTTSGKALPMMAPGTVDNFVMFGSPGSGVRNIDAYGLPEGRPRPGSRRLVRDEPPQARGHHSPERGRDRCRELLDADSPEYRRSCGGRRTRDSRLRQSHGVLRGGHAHLAGLRQHHRRRQADDRRGVGGPQEGARQPPAVGRRRVGMVEAGAHRILVPTLTHSEQLFALRLA